MAGQCNGYFLSNHKFPDIFPGKPMDTQRFMQTLWIHMTYAFLQADFDQ